MIDLSKIKDINTVIEAYFAKNTDVTIVPVKVLMPAFIEAGIFIRDYKNGKPIREVLRELDKNGQRELIPYIHSEEKDNNIYWYFIPANAPSPATPYRPEPEQTKKKVAAMARALSDESYVIDLCDTILKRKAERQKRFDFLLGDLHKDGKTKTKLPVDAYYAGLKLVVEFTEVQPKKPAHQLIKRETKMASGPNRAAQKKIYDKRRAEVLPKNDIQLVVIPHNIFKYNDQHKIIRNTEKDLKTVMEVLKDNDIDFEV